MKRSKYRTTKRLFYAGLIFTSLSLFSAGFASFNIYGGNDESLQGKIDIANIIQIDLTNVSEGFQVYSYKISDYNERGFIHEGTLDSGETYQIYNFTCYFDLYFHVVSKQTINNYVADFQIKIGQNNITDYTYFLDVNFKSKGADITYTTDQDDLTASGSNATKVNTFDHSLTNGSAFIGFNSDLILNADEEMYFHLRYYTTFHNSDNYASFYNWITNVTSTFSFSVSATISPKGGN